MAAGFLGPLIADGAPMASSQPAWLAQVRSNAFEQLARDGLPSPRSEAWKYTSLRALGQRQYQRGDSGAAARSIDAGLLDLPGVDGPRLVFVNGAFRADLSHGDPIDGLELGALSHVLDTDPDSVQSYLARSFDNPVDVFARLNTALAADGPVIRVAAGRKDLPLVHLIMVGAAASAELAWQLRGIIEVGEGAALRVVEHHVGESGQAHFGNVFIQIALGVNARLDLLQIQNSTETASLTRRTEAVLAADAHLEMRSIEVFHGAITVNPGADGSDAYLSNKNLLLSAQAEIDTQPVLEIYADEVKAAHGATVGQLDEQALFYLRSRGLSADEARSLLTLAFCRIAFDSIENEALREHVDTLLLERLPQQVEYFAGDGKAA